MWTAARPHACWLLAALCGAAVGCEAFADDEPRDCTLQESYLASFTKRSGGDCIPETQTLRVTPPELLETFIDTKVETISARDGCTVQLVVTTRDRFSGTAISQLSGSVVPAADSELRGLFTFKTFDAEQGVLTCQATVDAELAPLYTGGTAATP